MDFNVPYRPYARKIYLSLSHPQSPSNKTVPPQGVLFLIRFFDWIIWKQLKPRHFRINTPNGKGPISGPLFSITKSVLLHRTLPPSPPFTFWLRWWSFPGRMGIKEGGPFLSVPLLPPSSPPPPLGWSLVFTRPCTYAYQKRRRRRKGAKKSNSQSGLFPFFSCPAHQK